MGLLDRVDGSGKMITCQNLKALGFREVLNENTLNYWFHGGGSSYIKISMPVNAREYKACGYVGDDLFENEECTNCDDCVCSDTCPDRVTY